MSSTWITLIVLAGLATMYAVVGFLTSSTFLIWWHHRVLRHPQTSVRVSVPVWDPGSKGVLVRCGCGKDWAL